jgi:Bacterial extracellular solute-binding proteins, family 5 Middle
MKLVGSWASIIDRKTAIAAGEWDGTEATWKDWPNKDLNNSSLNKTDMGSGAYMMVSREVTQAIFKANPNYWGEKGKLENVIFKMVDEQSSRRLALKNNDADIVAIGNPIVVLNARCDNSPIPQHNHIRNLLQFQHCQGQQIRWQWEAGWRGHSQQFLCGSQHPSWLCCRRQLSSDHQRNFCWSGRSKSNGRFADDARV